MQAMAEVGDFFTHLNPILVAVLLLAAIWLLVELVRLVKKSAPAVEGLSHTVEAVNARIEQLEGTVSAVNTTLEGVTPLLENTTATMGAAASAAEALTPLVESVTLTVDAVSLEIMRLDQVMDGVQQLTDNANATAERVGSIAKAPATIAGSIAGGLRRGSKDHAREKEARKVLDGSAKD